MSGYFHIISNVNKAFILYQYIIIIIILDGKQEKGVILAPWGLHHDTWAHSM